jgi:hypothetical protein
MMIFDTAVFCTCLGVIELINIKINADINVLIFNALSRLKPGVFLNGLIRIGKNYRENG